MTYRILVASVVLALGGVALGRTLTGPTPWLLALLAAGAIGGGIASTEAHHLRRVTSELSRWPVAGYRPVTLRRRGGWAQLGAVINLLGAALERQVAELARERPWRRELVETLVDPALLFSPDRRLLAANDPARALFGISMEAGALTVVQSLGNATLASAVTTVQDTGVASTVDEEHGEHDLRCFVSQVGDETLLLVRDRTQERRVEQLRRNFVVNASHELKTPVTSIQTLAGALAIVVEQQPARLTPLLRRLDREAERLSRLVHDLLDLRRLEEQGPLERNRVDLADLLRQTVVGLLDTASEREIEISVDAPDRAPTSGAPGDLQAIVKNLVDNALQYNHPGGRVDVSLTAHHDVHVMIVRDNGIGISQHDLSRIFERFYRVDPARSRATGGTGLGLSIVRHAVERHGGTIGVDSLLGEGTTFTLTLPIQGVERETEPPQATTNVDHLAGET